VFTTGLDFTIPSQPSSGDDGKSAQFSLYVPLVAVAKRKLADIDVEDDRGCHLPVLTRQDEAQLLLETAVELWKEYTEEDLTGCQITVTDELKDNSAIEIKATVVSVIAELIMLQPKQASRRMKWLDDSGILDRITDDTQRAYFRTFLKLLVTTGVLYTKIDDAIALQRRLIKISFRDRLPFDTRQGPAEQRRTRRVAERVLQSCGIRSTPLIWKAPAGQVGTYHLEAEAPDGLVFLDSLLTEDEPSFGKAWSARFKTNRIDQGNPNAKYVHLYRGDGAPDSKPLLHALYLRTPPNGWLLATAGTTFIFALAMTLISSSIRTLYGNDQATTTASILLGIGAVAAVFLARPLEHSFTSRLLRGARIALVAMALSALVAIGLLLRVGVAPPHVSSGEPVTTLIGSFGWIRWYCTGLAWAAFAIILASLASWLYARWRLAKLTPQFQARFAARGGLSE
jgi:hypothetical protein